MSAALALVWKVVPWQVWAILGAGLALLAADAGFHIWLRVHDSALEAEVTTAVKKERNDFWQGREDAANAAHAKTVALLQLKLDTSLASAREAAAAHARQLSAERLKRQAAEAELDRQRSINVTPEADRGCVVTAGVVRQFNIAASVANGHEDADLGGAAGAGPVDVNAPAGVSLSALSGAVDGAGKAFGACRERVTAWETYHATVIAPWIASTLEALQLCVPKGAP